LAATGFSKTMIASLKRQGSYNASDGGGGGDDGDDDSATIPRS